MPLALVLPTSVVAAPDDPLTITKLKLRLAASEGTESVRVDAIDGQVILFGMVTSQEARLRAEAMAKATRGVSAVDNRLMVRARARTTTPRVPDAALRTRIERSLAAKAETKGVRVAQVKGGVVDLDGEVKSLSTHLYVVQLVRAVRGVRAVTSSVQAPDRLSDEEVFAHKGMESARDLRLASLVKLRLFLSRAVMPKDIAVDVHRSVTTLSGTVPTLAAKKAAGREAARVSGVKRVQNALRVVASKPVARNEPVPADVILKEVEAGLRRRPELRMVEVRMEGTTAVLKGVVPSTFSRLDALRAARMVDAVLAVRDEMQLGTEVQKGDAKPARGVAK